MKTSRERQLDVIGRFVEAVRKQPLLESGMWYHDDIRNNFYAASYLIAASADLALEKQTGRDMKAVAESVLLRIFNLQDRDAGSGTFGHFPLHLAKYPEVKANPLPAEIMGSMLVYFASRYESELSSALKDELSVTIEALYRSGYYRRPVLTYNHHEAKYTASKLIFGYRFGDQELLEDGAQSLRLLLKRVREEGMAEYGSLPWFWHWMQAFACALACVPISEISTDVRSLLDELWMYRASYYLKGAWLGGRMRSLRHDLPRDGNAAFDYVEFGDFPLPQNLPRVEYAGLLNIPAPERARQLALDVDTIYESEKLIVPAGGTAGKTLRSYIYRTADFAVGGVYERKREFDNEQHRWDIAFPLMDDESINHLYFFAPGDGYVEGDPRHEADDGEVLFRQNVVAALYSQATEELVGVLPKGEWAQRAEGIFGRVQGVLISVYMHGTYSIAEDADRMTVRVSGNNLGVVIEANRSVETTDLSAYADHMSKRQPRWEIDTHGDIAVSYTLLNLEEIHLCRKAT